jgi:photosystem II stability/assembly factor-like uncharacterized protein
MSAPGGTSALTQGDVAQSAQNPLSNKSYAGATMRRGLPFFAVLLASAACGGGGKLQRPPAGAAPHASAAPPHPTPDLGPAETGKPATLAPPAFHCEPSAPPTTSGRAASEGDPGTSGATAEQPARSLTWRRLTPPRSVGAPRVQALLVTPSSLIVAGRGISRSLDGGRTWADASVGIRRTEQDEPEALDWVVFTGTSLLTAGEKRLYRSSDGTSWVECGAPLPSAVPYRAYYTGLTWRSGTLQLTAPSGSYESTDDGLTWFAASTTGGTEASIESGLKEKFAQLPFRAETIRQHWPLPDGLLALVPPDLYRLGDDGSIMQAYQHELYGVDTAGAEVFALTASYIARSSDGARTFREERFSGLADDDVEGLSVYGKNVALVGSGPTVHTSVDGGKTWKAGPDLELGATALATKDYFFFAGRLNGTRPTPALPPVSLGALYRAAAPGTAWERVALPPESGEFFPVLLAGDGDALAIQSSGTGNYFVSRDHGEHWSKIPWSYARIPAAARAALLRGPDLFLGPTTELYASHAGRAFKPVLGGFPNDHRGGSQRLFTDGAQTYFLASGRLYAWDRSRNTVIDLGARLPGSPQHPADVRLAAVQQRRVLVVVQGGRGDRLLFSADLGGSWQTASLPSPNTTITVLASSPDGILAGTTNGLWLLP